MSEINWRERNEPWIAPVAERILANLEGKPLSEEQKDEIVQQAIDDTEAGRPFNFVAPEESKPKEDPLTSRGEKLSDLRKKARTWAGWES